MSDLHETRVLAGYKATLHNPNTSAEAKERAEEILREAGVDVDELVPAATSSIKHESGSAGNLSPTKSTHSKSIENITPVEQEEHTQHVLAGLKATLHNARTSETAKEQAREKIAEIEREQEKHLHHIIGGYKATLHNERTSPEAKAHARAMLEDMGVDTDEL